MYYRITCNNLGIYNIYKHLCTQDEWNFFINSSNFNWLPQPPIYHTNYRSFFTQEGDDNFIAKTLPIITNKIELKNININKVDITENIIYKDKYQVVVEI